eukprot:7406591-Alexandrium_andersonii.AAC.1
MCRSWSPPQRESGRRRRGAKRSPSSTSIRTPGSQLLQLPSRGEGCSAGDRDLPGDKGADFDQSVQRL